MFEREYRDHRLEWMLRSGGVEIVLDGMQNGNIRFSTSSNRDAVSVRPRRFWGWGWEGEGPSPEQQQAIAQALAARFGLADVSITPPPRIDELALRPPRVAAPRALAALCSTDPTERAGHTYGKSFRDVVRALRRDFRIRPTWSPSRGARPTSRRVLDWCARRARWRRSRTAAARASSAASSRALGDR